MRTVRTFQAIAVVEATSWLALIVATVVKYSADAPLGVKILGPIHGVLFIGYVLLALQLRSQLRWPGRTLLIVLADAIIPGGGFVAARRQDVTAAATATG
jgi:integral membrane protein